eukprot:278492_1
MLLISLILFVAIPITIHGQTEDECYADCIVNNEECNQVACLIDAVEDTRTTIKNYCASCSKKCYELKEVTFIGRSCDEGRTCIAQCECSADSCIACGIGVASTIMDYTNSDCASSCGVEPYCIDLVCAKCVIPTIAPTRATATPKPTMDPTRVTPKPTDNPSATPTISPTDNPSANPTDNPSADPSANPTASPVPDCMRDTSVRLYDCDERNSVPTEQYYVLIQIEFETCFAEWVDGERSALFDLSRTCSMQVLTAKGYDGDMARFTNGNQNNNIFTVKNYRCCDDDTSPDTISDDPYGDTRRLVETYDDGDYSDVTDEDCDLLYTWDSDIAFYVESEDEALKLYDWFANNGDDVSAYFDRCHLGQSRALDTDGRGFGKVSDGQYRRIRLMKPDGTAEKMYEPTVETDTTDEPGPGTRSSNANTFDMRIGTHFVIAMLIFGLM